MKNVFLTLALLIGAFIPAFGQSKKELQAQVVSLQASIKEMQATNDALAFENKTLRKRIDMIRQYVEEASDNLPAATPYESTSLGASTSTSYSGSRTSSTTSSYSSSYSGSTGRVIYTGPRGGRYYINSKGNKVYLKR